MAAEEGRLLVIVKTTMRPKEWVEVSESEYLDLKRWGLVAAERKPTASPKEK